MEAKEPPRILVAIINYRTPDLTIDCLRSLEPEVAAAGGMRIQVVVADNASGDDSIPRLESAIAENGWRDWARLLPLERNGGFSYGNNGVIRPALASNEPPDYVWLLNSDTVVRPGALATLVGFLESRPEVGFAGSRLEDRKGKVEDSAFRFPSILGELENGARLGVLSRLLSRWVVSPPAPSSASSCDWTSGASLMVRRTVLEQAGLFDEQFFLYYEEVDLCLRARQAGWGCWYVPEARVLHLAGQSSGVTGRDAARRRVPDYWFASRRHYFHKHLGRVRTFLADLAWSLGFFSFRVRQWIQRKPDLAPASLLRDFLKHNFLPTPRTWGRKRERAAESRRLGVFHD